MCGIVAEWNAEGVEPGALLRAVEALRHRGPDGEGTWLAADRTLALGHTRLAVIDPTGGAQPIASEDGQVVLAVNGEFYDHARMRRRLKRRGHRFRSRSDSEIAVHLYEEQGLDFLAHLRGEFALVLWDARQEMLIAARDRFGVKPLCYHHEPGRRLRLASEAKALFALGVRPAWDEETLFQVAGMQYQRPEQTLFAGVRQLRPGHVLVARRGHLSVTPWWDLDYPRNGERPSVPLAEQQEQLRTALDEAVRLRLRADVPVCFHLSGGLDSSAVVALAARHRSSRPHCFTVSFDEPGYDEQAAARETAWELGVRLEPVAVRQRDLADHFGDAVWFSEGLAINGHLPAKYLLARAIRQSGFKVVLSGEGSDEVLGGYAHFQQDLLDDRGEPATELRRRQGMLAGMHLAEGEPLDLSGVCQVLGTVPAFLAAKATLGRRMQSLLRDDFRERFAGRDPLLHFLAAFDVPGQLHGRHRVEQSSYLWTRSALANYILRTLGDGTEMAHAVEGRLPFLDPRVVEAARQIGVNRKIVDGVEKWILREALRGVLPESVRSRRKQPFTAPPLSLYGDGTFVQDVLRSEIVNRVPFLDPARVVQALDGLAELGQRERIAWDPVLMLALSACLMQERFGM
jgi:asparagine synthase (glutamine-hydrolysing)